MEKKEEKVIWRSIFKYDIHKKEYDIITEKEYVAEQVLWNNIKEENRKEDIINKVYLEHISKETKRLDFEKSNLQMLITELNKRIYYLDTVKAKLSLFNNSKSKQSYETTWVKLGYKFNLKGYYNWHDYTVVGFKYKPVFYSQFEELSNEDLIALYDDQTLNYLDFEYSCYYKISEVICTYIDKKGDLSNTTFFIDTTLENEGFTKENLLLDNLTIQ